MRWQYQVSWITPNGTYLGAFCRTKRKALLKYADFALRGSKKVTITKI